MWQGLKNIIQNIYKWVYVIIAFIFTACVTPFEPEIDKYEDLLVVDGAISNIQGSGYVRLSKTSTYNNREKKPVNAARITLIDDIDNQIQFLNPQPGFYILPDPEFTGQIGRSYKIHIETAGGLICESSFEELKKITQFPFVWKTAQFGYDGTGVKIVRNENDHILPNAFKRNSKHTKTPP